jgi:hypothetical protein
MLNCIKKQNKTSLTLVHGLFVSDQADAAVAADKSPTCRATAFEDYAETLGVRNYEWVDGRGKVLANRLLRLARGTAIAVDALEIIELDEAIFRASLVEESTRERWREIASCTAYGFDVARSFTLIGAPLQLLEGPARGQRILWFGRGLGHLSKAEFVSHYTGQHGPLVAGHAEPLGLRRYRQVPGEESELVDALHELGFGQADAPAVFAELYMGAPPLNLASLRARRAATREIKIDEKRHIDFSRSMLLLG